MKYQAPNTPEFSSDHLRKIIINNKFVVRELGQNCKCNYKGNYKYNSTFLARHVIYIIND